MGFLIRLYFNALFDNKPLVVIPTLVVGGTIGIVGIFVGVVQRDTASIVMMAVVALMLFILLAVGFIDRKMNPDVKNRTRKKAGTGPTSRTGRR